jgi:hypothetical protein
MSVHVKTQVRTKSILWNFFQTEVLKTTKLSNQMMQLLVSHTQLGFGDASSPSPGQYQ